MLRTVPEIRQYSVFIKRVRFGYIEPEVRTHHQYIDALDAGHAELISDSIVKTLEEKAPPRSDVCLVSIEAIG